MTQIECTQCGRPYPQTGIPFKCLACGGVFDFVAPPPFDPKKIDNRQPGMWKYKSAFGLTGQFPLVTLGEGGTPLVWRALDGVETAFKLESLNPTGSYKDRGTAILVSQLLARGARQAVEDSSGNAGASFAAYAAAAGLKATIFVPQSASGPKRTQIERYGAELISVPGPRSEAAREVLLRAAEGVAYASHAYLPFGLAGIATIAYELWEQVGGLPGTVIAPAGHGGLMLGIVRGFKALQQAGLTKKQPYYITAQAEACAPMVVAARSGIQAINTLKEGDTIAEGVRVRSPIRLQALLNEITAGKGEYIAVPEEEILRGYYELARMGFFVEPTSALAWCAFQALRLKLPQPVVIILTGSGLKYAS